MICRIWHGWTTHANADAYERLLREEVFVGIEGRQIAGFHGIELLRRAARAVLARFDARSAHYDVRIPRTRTSLS